MTDTTTRALPAQRPTPVLPTTPRSLVDATVRGFSRRKGRELRDVEVLRVAPDLDGGAA